MRVSATAPATTANLGPGFDCLGAAISMYVKIVADTSDPGSWAYAGRDPDPGPDLVVAAVRAGMGSGPVPGLYVESGIPLARGLGSSSAAVAAGVLAGCALAGREAGAAEVLSIGLPLEGHPDNLAAALYGGLTLVVPSGGEGEGQVLRFDPVLSVRPVIVVPDERLSTARARKALPRTVELADAVANVAWTAGLVTLLTGGAPVDAERLLRCTQDRLHQPHRAPLMPGTMGMVASLRDGGVAAAVSGAGPSVVCFALEGQDEVIRRVVDGEQGWRAMHAEWDLEGARIVEVTK